MTLRRTFPLLFLCACFASAQVNAAAQEQAAGKSSQSKPSQAKKHKKQVGKASIYHRKFANRKMANGDRMDMQGDNAASKTLPLGSRAVVKNLETGKSATVTIEDRGPFVQGRIIDLSPATAADIGLTRKEGLAQVEVTPLPGPAAASESRR